MKRLLDWLDDRTGYRHWLGRGLLAPLPGGPGWRYTLGRVLVFLFLVQVITGFFLWSVYSPSETTAWESTYYLTYQMQGGALLRGLHRLAASAMILLLVLHLVQVVLSGAYRPPREIAYWTGLLMLVVVFKLGLTGYWLPADQKAYWSTQVVTSVVGLLPGIGTQLKQLVLGGPRYNHHTLTHLAAIHMGLLPAVLALLLWVHLAQRRRHGPYLPQGQSAEPRGRYWPDQVWRNGLVALAVLGGLIAAVVYWLPPGMTAPAQPAREFAAARPAWFFLFLFRFRQVFESLGSQGELLGALVIPGLAFFWLLLFPWIGRRRLGHVLNIVVLLVFLGTAGYFTALAVYEDHNDRDFQNAKWLARREAETALALARQGIPLQGARWMMNHRPAGRAFYLFAGSCLKCHPYSDGAERGFVLSEPSAPNLWRFASPEWIAGLLDPKQIDSPHYFGNTPLKEGDMVAYVKEDMPEAEDDQGNKLFTPQALQAVAAALAAEAGYPNLDPRLVQRGRELLADDSSGCAQCHKFHDSGDLGSAPDLTGYGSREWLVGMISNPGAERFYGHLDPEQQAMPAFLAGQEGASAEAVPREVIEALVDWLLADRSRPAP